MRKQFGLLVPISISVSAILLLVSCGGANTTQPNSDTTSASVKDTRAEPPAPRYNLTGYLDTLWIPVAVFDTLKKRVTLRFYIKAPDMLTLRGWSGDNTVFNNAPPDVILFNGRASTSAQFGQDNYFGNLQLAKDDIKAIQRLINSTNPRPSSVLFAPLQASSNAGQINYIIFLTSDDPNPLAKNTSYLVIPTGVNTNPSPPRNGN